MVAEAALVAEPATEKSPIAAELALALEAEVPKPPPILPEAALAPDEEAAFLPNANELPFEIEVDRPGDVKAEEAVLPEAKPPKADAAVLLLAPEKPLFPMAVEPEFPCAIERPPRTAAFELVFELAMPPPRTAAAAFP